MSGVQPQILTDTHPPRSTTPLAYSETCIRNSSELAGQGSSSGQAPRWLGAPRGQPARTRGLGCWAGLAGWLPDTPLRSLAADGSPRPFFRCQQQPKRSAMPRPRDRSVCLDGNRGSSSSLRLSRRDLDVEQGLWRSSRGAVLPVLSARERSQRVDNNKTATTTTTTSHHPAQQAVLNLYKPTSAKQPIRQVDISTRVTHAASMSETQKLSVSGAFSHLSPTPRQTDSTARTHAPRDHGPRHVGWLAEPQETAPT